MLNKFWHIPIACVLYYMLSQRFRDEVFPCFNEFMNEPAIVQASNDLVGINSMPPKKRRYCQTFNPLIPF